MRLIDADALRAEFLENRCNLHGAITVDEMPTVDAVSVVRCKDCKNWNGGDCYRQELTLPEDFCSYGEREEELL